MMKIKILLISVLLVLSVFSVVSASTDNQAIIQSMKNKAELKKHFTGYGNVSTILCESFTYTDYFSDSKKIFVEEKKGNIHVWGTIKVKKGSFKFTITTPKGTIVFNKKYDNNSMITVDHIFKPINGAWIFNITCFTTSGEYQIMVKQL